MDQAQGPERAVPPEGAQSSRPPASWPVDPVARAAAAAAVGLRRPAPPEAADAVALLVQCDPDPRVRGAALGAVVRLAADSSRRRPEAAGTLTAATWVRAVADPDPTVRRRAGELAPAVVRELPGPGGRSRATVAGCLVTLLADHDSGVAEAAACALGELGGEALSAQAVPPLAALAAGAGDPLVREAAVAALGSLGDFGGLPAVLAACADRPAIRRRAVLALAAFEGPEVEAALEAALADRDWQVRQAAEDLRGTGGL